LVLERSCAHLGPRPSSYRTMPHKPLGRQIESTGLS
jgi:hypothetical protein